MQPANHSSPQQTSCSGRSHGNRQGFILLLVLGFIVLLAWLSVVVSGEIRRQMQLQGQLVERAKLRPAAYQTLELTLAALAEIKELDGGFYSPVQGWGDPLRYLRLDESLILPEAHAAPIEVYQPEEAVPEDDFEDVFSYASLAAEAAMRENARPAAGRTAIIEGEPLQLTLSDPIIEPSFPAPVQVRVLVEDESGKVALNHASETRLTYLFEAMGFDTSEAEILSHSLLDWIDADESTRAYGAESNFYQQLRPPYSAANRPISDLRELRLVNGFRTLFFDETGKPLEAFTRLGEVVSVYNTDNKINLNTAPEPVLRMLEEEIELVPENITRYLAGNDMILGTADDRILRPDIETDDLPRGGGDTDLDFSVQARFLKLTIQAGAGNSVFTLRVLLDLSKAHPGGLYPFSIVQIVENGELY